MPGGRPTVMTPEVIRILEDAFSNAATDREACFLANISESTFYLYCEEHPEFSERKEALKKMVNYKAKRVVISKIDEGDEKQANWWLDRKGKDEGFTTRQEMSGPDGEEIGVILFPQKHENPLETTTEAGDSTPE